MSVALIDGDEVAFKASSVSQGAVDWDGDGEVTAISNVDRALKAAKQMIDGWQQASRCERVKVILSPTDRTNFRKRVLASYKFDRGTEKPAEYWRVVDWMKSSYDSETAPSGLEADDLLGVYASQIQDSVLCSSDKDMGTVPCRWLRPLKLARPRPVKVNAKTADWNWMTQTLVGDTTDGYKGCPRVGPVTAAEILSPHFGNLGAMWEAVVEAFVGKGLTEAHALAQARCARILRYGDVDLEARIIYLWHPRTRVPISME